MRIRILTENTANKRGLIAEHGLSLIIEANNRKILFDSGQSDVYIKNAAKLKEDLTNLDAIILSHGHYDHCGGIEFFPQADYWWNEKKLPPLYVREGAFRDKRHYKEGNYAQIGIDWPKSHYKGQIIETGERYDFGGGFTLLGKIGYETEFEPKPEGFFIVKENFPPESTLASEQNKISEQNMPSEQNISSPQSTPNLTPDLMEDEQLLVVETPQGLSLFMGCSHMGIINCIRRVQKEFPGKRIHSILAGMHLKSASQTRLKQTIEELKKLDFDYLIPVHCTGLYAIIRMKQELGERCLLAEAGLQLEL